MATKSISLRAILKSLPDTGADSDQEHDESYTVSGFDDVSYRKMNLAPDAEDEAVALIDDLSALVIMSLNGEPFSLRLDAAERLMTLGCFFACGFGAEDQVVLGSGAGSVLLTGNTENAVELLIVQVATT
jgi:hypothetical protein